MQRESDNAQSLPPRFAELKRSLVPQDEESKTRLIAAWNDLLAQLKEAAEEIKAKGSSVCFLCTLLFGVHTKFRYIPFRLSPRLNFRNCST